MSIFHCVINDNKISDQFAGFLSASRDLCFGFLGLSLDLPLCYTYIFYIAI